MRLKLPPEEATQYRRQPLRDKILRLYCQQQSDDSSATTILCQAGRLRYYESGSLLISECIVGDIQNDYVGVFPKISLKLAIFRKYVYPTLSKYDIHNTWLQVLRRFCNLYGTYSVLVW